MSSTWQSRITLSIFGQSHGAAIGMTLDGIPAGESIDMAALEIFLQRRAPGRFPWSTPRREADQPEFLSGIVNGKTCGAPITAIIRNENTRPADYAAHRTIPRPGHADFTALKKYGDAADISGGGHFSGRLTAALCIAGGICLQLLARRGIYIGAHIQAVGNARDRLFDPVHIDVETLRKLTAMDIPTLDSAAADAIIEEIRQAKEDNDSVGGVIECAIIGLPVGLGEPMFDGMENRIARLVFAIPAVKALEFGTGTALASMRGSTANDAFCIIDGQVATRTNHHGGILGGITSGMPLIFRTTIKPTPSIGREQESVDLHTGESAVLSVKGRHDPCIVPRAVPCVEAVAALAVYDALLDA